MTRVLLVEDEVDLLELVSEGLDAHGIHVTGARSGVVALSHLRGGAVFDVLVSDIAMPGGVSGIDVAVEASRAHMPLRIILTSGHPLSHFPELPENVTFLSKPYRIRQLLEAMRAAMP
ncbi:response regulator [Pseudoxanthomonas mexicana]|uniref:response regulator n=1 Tax=Pseudoxanthomonas mexicana TaxID=128785 RepID=UPI0028A71060|nr:response regulator [Pseudoxanthomonas mexicana]